MLIGPCLACHRLAQLDPSSGRCPLCPWEPAAVRVRRKREAFAAACTLLRDALAFVLLLILLIWELVTLAGLLFPEGTT